MCADHFCLLWFSTDHSLIFFRNKKGHCHRCLEAVCHAEEVVYKSYIKFTYLLQVSNLL